MAIDIPIFDLDAFDEVVQLDDAPYRLTFRWASRTSSWYLSVDSGDDTRLVSGKRLVPGVEPLTRYKSQLLPPGKLMAIDVEGNDVPPGRDDLDERVVITYLDEDEVAAALAALDVQEPVVVIT